jgi:hypothetical protein
VDHEEKTVSVLAIGVKEGNRLLIGGEEPKIRFVNIRPRTYPRQAALPARQHGK